VASERVVQERAHGLDRIDRELERAILQMLIAHTVY
jgi:hypothetical protein